MVAVDVLWETAGSSTAYDTAVTEQFRISINFVVVVFLICRRSWRRRRRIVRGKCQNELRVAVRAFAFLSASFEIFDNSAC